MQEVRVKIPLREDRGYTINVGANAIEKISSLFELGGYTKIVVVTDDAVQSPLLQKLTAALPAGAKSVTLPAGEKYKNIETVQKLWAAFHDAGCDRKSLVINLGGGVIGDIGGFAASTYMRGIDFINVPTTLLSQVDASVGGKNGFNFGGIKNLIGTFSQPIGIVIDPQTLATLPEREFISGFGEIIKHGVIRDGSYFDKVTSKRPAEFSQEELIDIIAGSCRIKLDIIEGDIEEDNIRKLVNFGHTVGHAVEALSHEGGTPLLHGEAISVGMSAEATISTAVGLLPAAELGRIKKALQRSGLPITVRNQQPDAIRNKMQSDKKNSGGKLRFTLIDSIGHAVYDKEAPESAVTEAIEAILD